MKAPTHRAKAPARRASPRAGLKATPKPPDPISVAADAMVRAAIEAAKFDIAATTPPGSATIIKVANSPWVEPVAEAARRILPWADHPDRVWLTVRGASWMRHDDMAEMDAIDLLLAGKLVVAVVDNTRNLPDGFVRTADHILTVAAPSWQIIRKAAASVGLTTEEPVPEAECQALTPEDLRLACRPGGDGGVWVRRMRPHHETSGATNEPRIAAPLDRLVDAMVGRAMATLPGQTDTLRKRGTAIAVETPSADWNAPVGRALRRLVGDDEAKPAPKRRGWATADDDDDEVQPTDRLWIIRDGTAKDHKGDVGNDKVGGMLATGGSVIGVAPTMSALPSDLVRTADLRLRIPPPDRNMIEEIAGGDAGASSLTDTMCRVLAPGDYEASMRPGENPDRWITRLKAIAETRIGGTRGPTLDDLHGMDEATDWGRSLASDIAEYAQGKLPWSAVDRGCLLVGPPGTGKTTFARALARSCNVPLVLGSLGEWQASRDGYLGDCLKAMRGTFERARAAAPCILFVDEIDAFGDREHFPDRHADYCTQVVNAFLELVDGAGGREGLVVVGATNNPGRLDPAIVRSGRLDRTIRIGLPDETALAGILRHHLADELPDVDLMPVARRALGMTGADIERIVRGANRRGRTADRPVAIDDLLAELSGDGNVPAELLVRRAFHEAGHAIAYSELFPGSIICATVRSGQGVGGMVETALPSLLTRGDALQRIMCVLGGRAAEHIMTGAPSSGAGGAKSSDLAQATMLATAYYSVYGLEEGSLIWMGGETTDDVLVTLRADTALRRRVMVLLAEQYRAVFNLLSRHRPAIRDVADALMRVGALSGPEIGAIVASARGGDGGPS